MRVSGECIPSPGRPAWASDNACFQVSFAGGGAGTLGYWSGGEKTFPKEAVEVFGAGISARLDDFKSAVLHSPAGRRDWASRAPDKGHAEEMRLFVLAARGEAPPPIPHSELIASSRATLIAARSLVERRPLDVPV